MSLIDQYQARGLSNPLVIRSSWKMHLLVWGGSTFLLLCAVLALRDDSLLMKFIGGFAIVFFGFAMIVFGGALIRGRARGLVEFSNDGLWLSTLGITLPWRAIGPAWVNTTHHAGGKTDDVVFIVRDIDTYAKNLDPLAALHLRLLKRTFDVGKGGAMDFGLRLVLGAADASDQFEKLQAQIEFAREQAASDSSAVLLNIPVPLRIGIDPQSLVAILNAESSRHVAAVSPISK